MRNFLSNFCSPKLYMTHALILRNLKQSHQLWHTGNSLQRIKHKNRYDIFVYLHRQSQPYLLPVIILYMEGGKQVQCPADVHLFVDFIYPADEAYHKPEVGQATLERLKTLRKYFSLKFRSSLTSIFSSNIQVCITCQSHSFVVELVQNQEEATDLMLRKALQSMSLPLTSVGLMVNHLGEVESSCLGWNSCSAT